MNVGEEVMRNVTHSHTCISLKKGHSQNIDICYTVLVVRRHKHGHLILQICILGVSSTIVYIHSPLNCVVGNRCVSRVNSDSV